MISPPRNIHNKTVQRSYRSNLGLFCRCWRLCSWWSVSYIRRWGDHLLFIGSFSSCIWAHTSHSYRWRIEESYLWHERRNRGWGEEGTSLLFFGWNVLKYDGSKALKMWLGWHHRWVCVRLRFGKNLKNLARCGFLVCFWRGQGFRDRVWLKFIFFVWGWKLGTVSASCSWRTHSWSDLRVLDTVHI